MMEWLVHTGIPWVVDGFNGFVAQLSTNIFNAIFFSVIIAGVARLISRWDFISHRKTIALELSETHKRLVNGARWTFEAFRNKDAEAYKSARKPLRELEEALNSFELAYSKHFTVRQSRAAEVYIRRARDLLARLMYKRISREMSPDGDTLDLEEFAELLGPRRFGPLRADDWFSNFDGLLNDFLRSLGIWRRAKLRARQEATEAKKALVALAAELEPIAKRNPTAVLSAIPKRTIYGA